MKPLLVMNGLTRSGTTMVSRLIDSQPNMICLDELFQMPKVISSALKLGNLSYFIDKDMSEAQYQLTEEHRIALKLLLTEKLNYFMNKFSDDRDYRNTTGKPFTHVYGLTYDQYTELVKNIIFDEKPETRNPITYISELCPDLDLICLRWNVSHTYAPLHLNLENGYWLEVIRDPVDRCISAKTGLGVPLQVSAREVKANFDFLSSFQHPRLKIVKYEELVNSTEETLKEISDWLGVEIKNVPLISPTGTPFKPNTSKNAAEGKRFSHQDANSKNTIQKTDKQWQKKRLSDVDQILIKNTVGTNPYYDITAPQGFFINLKAGVNVTSHKLLLKTWRTFSPIIKKLKRVLPAI